MGINLPWLEHDGEGYSAGSWDQTDVQNPEDRAIQAKVQSLEFILNNRKVLGGFKKKSIMVKR